MDKKTETKKIWELYDEISRDVTQSGEAWCNYLDFASRIYKYKFDNALLIYAQNPDATMVAEKTTWEGKVGRKVNKDATAIAVFDVMSAKPELRTLFDVYQTSGADKTIPNLWRLTEENAAPLLARLKETHNYDADTMEQYISFEALRRINEIRPGFYEGIKRNTIGSPLAECESGEELKGQVDIMIWQSAMYLMYKRCGFDTRDLTPQMESITEYNNKSLLYRMGNCTTIIAQDFLSECAATLNQLARENREKAIQEKAQILAAPPPPSKDVKRSVSANIMAQANAQLSLFDEPETKQEADRINEILEKAIHEIALSGGVTQGGTDRIYDFFSKENKTTERVNFLKNEYGFCGSGLHIEGIRYISWSASGKGVDISFELDDKDYKERIKWTAIAKETQKCIDNGEYPIPETADEETPGIPFKYGDIISYRGATYEVLESSPNEQTTDIGNLDYHVNDHTYIIVEVEPWEDLKNAELIRSGENIIDAEDVDNYEADEVINAPVEEAEQVYKTEELAYEKPEKVIIAPDGPRTDYVYSPDDGIGDGGPKQKFRANIEAIETLNKIEAEHRRATADEQKILCKYVGWGGLAEAFDPSNEAWKNEYVKLKELLTDEEYKSARTSVLTAHYTPPEVIQEMYDTISRFGFKGGNILDPSMGTGLFFAAMPEEIRNNSNLYGYEIDDVSGRIAKQLHQNADIKIQGFETNEEPDNFYDVVISNIPFGEHRLYDPKLNKYKFAIHDYFMAKALDKVRPGGIVAFVASKWVMDKSNPTARKYLAEKADLVGSVRIPDKAFKQMANTRVTTDIIFLQKRERIVSNEPYWVNLGEDLQGIPVNAYYQENPDMMLGKMEYGTRYGENSTTDLVAFDDFDLKRDLHAALSNLNAEMTEYIGQDEDEETETIPADPSVKNFTYTFVDDSLYYRENSTMRRMDYQGKPLERITGMHEIRKITRDLIEAQAANMEDSIITELQKQLNEKYDAFVKKNGYISETANERVFRDDSDYPLICSLEKYNSDLKIYEKADMFSKRTIRPNIKITSVDNAVDALRVSLSEKGRVDFQFMSNLYRNTRYVDMYEELNGFVFINPEKVQGELLPHMSIEEFFDEMGNQDCIETADEYLSGNVRHKFHMAEAFAEDNPELFAENRQKLESVLPELLTAAEIDVSLGITWIDTEDYNQFMYETFETPYYLQNDGRNPIKIEYNPIINSFSIRNKGQDNDSVTVSESFGTKRKTAYEILEESLNMRSVTVRDPYEDENGKIKYKDNPKETMLARAKQDLIKSTFREWIFEDAERRKKYVDYYNETFNNLRLRKYDGSFLGLPGMSQELELRDYQKNAVARGLLSNTSVLLDHKVGAGKSFVMAAICMEQRRLGNLQKAIFVVPNHLTGQMGSEFLRLYPSAKILVTTKRDFEKQNRLKFISKIATGDWDAVIIGHSQFEKIAMSKERQIMTLEHQIDEIIGAVSVMREEQGENFTIKQMEKMKESLTTQIKELTDDTTKDDLITFESLGIDYMFVDEAHYYKNCAVFSKMNNVAGISQTRAKKSTDMLMKCKYMQEINDGKGVVFATGTPISNSMTEMFVMQRYLDPRELDKRDMQHFDAWAAQYGEVVTALELAPEGTGYRYRTRFAKFKNLPELLSMYHNFADVVTDEQLNLDIPKIRDGQSTIVACQPSDYVVLKMMEFVDRADAIHAGLVKSWQDNMLKITNEARLLATDSRLIDPMQDIDDNSKIRRCAENIYANYIDSEDIKGTQIAFCDIGTPKGEGIFDVYHALKDELIKKGIPEDEISFIHEAKTDTQKEALFEKMRSGEKRIIIGSTNKLGVGTNIQDRVVAMHHIDCPWRPSDIEQRDGRGLRHGNINDEVGVYRYVTQNTFDSYLWQLVENKQRFISQIKSGKMVGRTCEDIDEAVLSYAEVKAVATGDERIKEKMDIDLEVSRLQMLKANYDNQRYTLQDKFTFQYPKSIVEGEKRLDGLIKDKAARDSNHSEEFMMVINGRTYTERDEAGKRLMLVEHSLPTSDNDVAVGTYSGFELKIRKQAFYNGKTVKYVLSGERDYSIEPSDSPHGNTMRLDNALKGIEELINKTQTALEDDKRNLKLAETEYKKPFAYGDELEQKLKRQAELNKELNLDKEDDVIADEDDMSSAETVTDENSQKRAAVDTIPYSQNEKMNYLLLNTMFPDIVQGRSDYMKFKAEHYDDMYIERIGDNTYALCLFYIQNGDVMREPEYTFRIDRENKAARILDWTMSSMGIYQCVYSNDEPEKCDRGLKQDLDNAFNQMLKDIKNIDYTPYMSDEESDEYDVEM